LARAARRVATLALCGACAAFAHAAIIPLGPEGGMLLCSGRAGKRTPVAALDDGNGGILVLTRDPLTDPVNVPDGGDDIGLVRLDSGFLPVAGTEPCGDLLVGGSGHQTPRTGFAIAPGRYVVIASERGIDSGTYTRVFAWGFDATGRPIFPGIMVTPADPFPATDFPFGAADGAGGFFIGWQERPPGAMLTGRILVHRFDASGQPLWPAPVAVSAGALALGSFAGAVSDGSGGVFVHWIEPFPGDPDGYQPLVQHLDATGSATLRPGGARADPERRITIPMTLAPWRPATPRGVAGAIALAVADVPRAHLILADGTRPWGADGVALTPGLTGFTPSEPGFAIAPDGSLRVTWVETDGLMVERLVAHRLETDGRLPWSEPVVLIETDGIQRRSEVVLADGTLAVAAEVTATDPLFPFGDLVAQAIDARGRTRTAVSGFDLCRADGTQANPVIWPVATGGAGVIWADNREAYASHGADGYFTQLLAWTSMPRLDPTASTPGLRQGRSIVVSLAGDDLQPGLTIDAGAGLAASSIEVEALRPDGPGDRLTLEIRAAANAPIGRHALGIVNPDGGTAVTPVAFEVALDPARIDIDGSGRADGFDLVVLASSFGRAAGEPGYAAAADIDGSGLVDGRDLAFLAARFGDRFF
jgi:hypothetical protein